MDNAPCHSRYNDKVPTMATKGNDMRDWLRKHNILFPEFATKKSLYENLIAPLNKEEFNSYAVEKIAEENGILILRLPPYHCDLNPIELVWGWCKRQLRDELSRDDKLKAVMAATKEVFKKLPNEVVRGFFPHVQKTEKRYAHLDGVLLHDPARPLVIDTEHFEEDSDSEDEIDVDVIENCDESDES
jgi:transposase